MLLEPDPLEDIANARTIAGVMIAGRWLSRAELHDGLAHLADRWEADRAGATRK
ncbi:MAG: hypothetical protein IH616_18495 [Gemmatimonadales bacterium]|nr:hypothetical protein [Gemmatimonadales bacterium]